MKKIIDIPLTSVASVELFLNKFRYSIAQVSAQAQAKRPDCAICMSATGCVI